MFFDVYFHLILFIRNCDQVYFTESNSYIRQNYLNKSTYSSEVLANLIL